MTQFDHNFLIILLLVAFIGALAGIRFLASLFRTMMPWMTPYAHPMVEAATTTEDKKSGRGPSVFSILLWLLLIYFLLVYLHGQKEQQATPPEGSRPARTSLILESPEQHMDYAYAHEASNKRASLAQLGTSFGLQVGAMGYHENAVRLSDQLLEQGHPVQILRMPDGLYHVLVAPKGFTRSELQSYARRHNLDGHIIPLHNA